MKYLKSSSVLSALVIAFGVGTLVSHAQTYTPLAGLPIGEAGVTPPTYTMTSYLSGAIKLLIAIGASLSILIAIIGGTQYVAAGISPDAKNDAKTRIENALIGLTLILTSYLILNSINPKLVAFKEGLFPPISTEKPEEFTYSQEYLAAVSNMNTETIAGLNLVDNAREAASALKNKYPNMSFSSGRRTLEAQKNAMAKNLAQDIVATGQRNWITRTYSATGPGSTCRDLLQKEVDAKPSATTQNDFIILFYPIFKLNEAGWNYNHCEYISKHTAGLAFDIDPAYLGGATVEEIKSVVMSYGAKNFFTCEGGNPDSSGKCVGGISVLHADF